MYRGDAVRMVEGDREKGGGKREGGIGGGGGRGRWDGEGEGDKDNGKRGSWVD